MGILDCGEIQYSASQTRLVRGASIRGAQPWSLAQSAIPGRRRAILITFLCTTTQSLEKPPTTGYSWVFYGNSWVFSGYSWWDHENLFGSSALPILPALLVYTIKCISCWLLFDSQSLKIPEATQSIVTFPGAYALMKAEILRISLPDHRSVDS